MFRACDMYLLAVDLGVPWLLELSSKISDLINWIWLNLVLDEGPRLGV